GSVADAIIELIEQAAIPVCMVGLLYALPNTQLTRRLASEGRLNEELLFDPAAGMDQCTQALNFDTLRPRRHILSYYKRGLEKVYDPFVYARRLQRLAKRCSDRPTQIVKCVQTILGVSLVVWRSCIGLYQGCLVHKMFSQKRSFSVRHQTRNGRELSFC